MGVSPAGSLGAGVLCAGIEASHCCASSSSLAGCSMCKGQLMSLSHDGEAVG